MDATVAVKLSMRLLVVSYAFPPWLSPRSVQSERLLNHLSERGYEITVVSACTDQLGVPLDEELVKMLNNKIKHLPIIEPRYRFLEYLKNHYTTLQKIPDTANTWIPWAYHECRKIASYYDLLLTYSTPVSDHVLGYLIKRRYPDLPWVAFFSDPYMVNPYIRLSGIEKKINGWLEKLIIKNADTVIFVNEHTRRKTLARHHHGYSGKTIVIPHAFDETLYGTNNETNKILTIRHMGDFYGERTPEPLLKALSLMRKEDPENLNRITIEFYGNYNKAVREMIIKYGMQDLVFYRGQVNYFHSLRLMATSDVLLVIDSPSEENLFLTSKVIDYLGANVPILAITPAKGPTADLMRSIGYASYAAYDTASIARQILEYMELKKSGNISKNIPEKIYERYRIDNIARDYTELFKHLVSKSIFSTAGEIQ